MTLAEMIDLLGNPPAGVSDLHFRSERAVGVRCGGALRRWSDGEVTQGAIEALIQHVKPEVNLPDLRQHNDLSIDFAFSVADIRYRGQLSRFGAGRGLLLACRLLARHALPMETLGLPASLLTWLDRAAGLIVVAGATGSGKSTTLVSLVEWINAHEPVHILTLEDPIEYLFKEQCSSISQREIGIDICDFTSGAYAALRSDADVVLIGELREPGAARAALALAESGHRVLTTVHAGSAVSAIERLIALLGGDDADRNRSALAEQLIGVLCQRLVPVGVGEDRPRLLLYDTVSSLPTVAVAIREGRTVEVRARIQAAGNRVNQYDIEDAIASHLVSGRIDRAEAARLKSLHGEAWQ